MGFSLGSIVSDIKSLATDPGKAVKDICDAVLPGNMKAIGDIVGGAVDFETGHPLQALGHLTDALKDLPQLAQGMSGTSTTAAKPALAPPGTLAAEPTPPPTRAPVAPAVIASAGAPTSGATSALQTALSGLTTAPGSAPAGPASTAGTAASTTPATPTVTVSTGTPPGASAPAVGRSGQQVSFSVNVGGTSVTVTENERLVGRRNPQTGVTVLREEPVGRPTFTVTTAAAPGTQASATPTSNSVPTGASTSPPSGATSAAASGAASASGTSGTASGTSGTTAGGTSGTAANGSASKTASASTADASSPGDAAASTGAAATGGASTTGAPPSLASLMAMSPDQFMQAVTSGNIPPDVANNPAAMTQIQARMNQITQMNQLVTSMMAAMHQMQMSIIQNIRV